MGPSVTRRTLRHITMSVVFGVLAACLSTITSTTSAAAADGTFQQVTSFGSNPGNLAMYEYAPANLPAGAPLVVALHGCIALTSHIRFDQCQNRGPQPGIRIGHPLSASAGAAHPAQRRPARLQIGHTLRHGRLAHARGLGHGLDPAMPQCPRFRPYRQTALPLVQMREQHRELSRELGPCLR